MDSDKNKGGRPKGRKNTTYLDNQSITIRLDSESIEALNKIAINHHTTINKFIASLALDYLNNLKIK